MSFDIIYPDMPWEYKNYSAKATRSAQAHYDTHDVIEEFGDLPILSLASRNALLPMWVPYPHLFVVDRLVQKWNEQAEHKYERFTFRTVLNTWIKLNKKWKEAARRDLKDGLTDVALDKMVVDIFFNGLGKYTMGNPEIIVLYGRGSMKGGIERLDRTARNLQAFPIGKHSEKPDEFNALLSRVFPKAVCLELFARRKYDDERWTCLGNEISGRDIHEDLDAIINPVPELTFI